MSFLPLSHFDGEDPAVPISVFFGNQERHKILQMFWHNDIKNVQCCSKHSLHLKTTGEDVIENRLPNEKGKLKIVSIKYLKSILLLKFLNPNFLLFQNWTRMMAAMPIYLFLYRHLKKLILVWLGLEELCHPDEMFPKKYKQVNLLEDLVDKVKRCDSQTKKENWFSNNFAYTYIFYVHYLTKLSINIHM